MPRGIPGSGPTGKKRLAKQKAASRRAALASPAPLTEKSPMIPVPAPPHLTADQLYAKVCTLEAENAQLKRQNEAQTTQINDLRHELGEMAIDALRMMKQDRL